MLILGIETSCDETAVAVVEDGRKIRSSLVSSQLDLHAIYGGVVPEVASRRHIEVLSPLCQKTLSEAGISLKNIHAVAVTHGPGLEGALLVGVAYAKALSFGLGIPLIGVNHMEGHLYANFLENSHPEFPFLSLLVSGGHTELVRAEDHGKYNVLGRTRDDAAGEAFDKVARCLGLEFPGGPVIDRLAKEGNPKTFQFPKARLGKGSLDFSFSGIKTAVAVWARENLTFSPFGEIPPSVPPFAKGGNFTKGGDSSILPDVCASFQEAVVDVLVEKTMLAAAETKTRRILLGGGVAQNSRLREKLKQQAKQARLTLSIPSPHLCADNAAMIACAGFYMLQRGIQSDLTLDVVPNLRF